MDFSIVVYIIIVIIVVYYLISWWSSDSTQMITIHTTDSQLSVAEDKGAKESDVNCGYSIWINVINMEGGSTADRKVFVRDDIEMELDSTNKLLSYYTPEIHSASFVLPKLPSPSFSLSVLALSIGITISGRITPALICVEPSIDAKLPCLDDRRS